MMKWFWQIGFWGVMLSARAVAAGPLAEGRVLLLDDYALTDDTPPTWVHEGGLPVGLPTAIAGLLAGSNHYHRTGWAFLNCRMGQRSNPATIMYVPPQMTTNYLPSLLTTNYSANLMNTTDAVICSPVFEEGLGTLYFEAINTLATGVMELSVDIATNLMGGAALSGSMTNANVDWQGVCSVTLSATSVEEVTRVVERLAICQPAALRIRRSTTIGSALDNYYACVDNIRVSPPGADFVFDAVHAVVDAGGTFVACDISNVPGAAAPTDHTSRDVRLEYRWFSAMETRAWDAVAMVHEPATGTGGDGETWKAELAFVPGMVLEYRVVCTGTPAYQSPDYTEQGYAYAPETGPSTGTFTQGGGETTVVVQFDAQGGAVSPETGAYLAGWRYRDTEGLPTPVRPGHTFGGWFEDAACEVGFVNEVSIVPPTLTKLYAKWLPNDTYTVTFNGNGGAPGSQGVPQTRNSAYVLPAVEPVRGGWIFTGWFTATSGGTQVTAETTVTAPGGHTLYAHWRTGATYYVNGTCPDDTGDGKSWATAKKTIQAAIDLAPERSEIVVTNGVYAPILTTNQTFTIRSVNGAGVTVIDGGGTNRCATLGLSSWGTNTVLTGFTLRNGSVGSNASPSPYGGGSYGGTLNQCTLTNNWVIYGGGGAYGGVLRNCVLSGNNTANSTGGGAVASTLYNCTVSGNTAGTDGGGASSCTLIQCVLTGNTAKRSGGGAFESMSVNGVLSGNSASTYGGGACNGTLLNCTVTGNHAITYGGGTYGSTLNNCIVWENTAGTGANCLYGTVTFSCALPLPPGEGNIAQDPLFADAANGDVRLQANSPCICAGDNAGVAWDTDLDGNTRIWNSRVDMGAYEHHDAASVCRATFDGNGGDPESQDVLQTTSTRYTLPADTPACEGYLFQGWFTAVTNGAQVTAASVVMPTTNHTLYAQWISNTYTVTFDGNGGVPESQSITMAYDGNYVLPADDPVRAGYVFTGWFTATSGGTQVTSTTQVTTADDHTLHAQWRADTIRYVNASQANDASNGTTWATAKRTIQAAVDSIVVGGEVIVTNGIYAPISTGNKDITIHSVNGAGVTVIDGGGTNRCATLGSEGAHASTVLSGFTLRNGRAEMGGGAYYGTLNNCVLTGNTAVVYGYGGGAYGGTLNNCVLAANTANMGGGAFYSMLNNCTLSGNTATLLGGGAYYGTLDNCIAWGNTAAGGGDNQWMAALRYSCSAPLPGGDGNIAHDPLFEDAANGNFRLQANSPCVCAGDNAAAAGDVDLDGTPRILNDTVCMGAYEFSATAIGPLQDIPVPVPIEWLTPYRGWQGAMGYVDLTCSEGANGYRVWESYVAGLVPTNAASRFAITDITVDSDNGKDTVATLDWTPRRADRTYTVWGKTNLTDTTWGPTNAATRFFKVSVDL